VISEAQERENDNYFKVNKSYQGNMANNKKGIRELPKKQIKTFL
jgi:hypothetical protein